MKKYQWEVVDDGENDLHLRRLVYMSLPDIIMPTDERSLMHLLCDLLNRVEALESTNEKHTAKK
jgi:hypothetical protein